MIEKQTSKQDKRLCTDKALEFYSNEFNGLCKFEGILRHLIVLGTSLQNGVVEQMNKILMEKVQCVLFNTNLPKFFWAEAASIVCLLINLAPFYALNKKTMYELWFGSPDNTLI